MKLVLVVGAVALIAAWLSGLLAVDVAPDNYIVLGSRELPTTFVEGDQPRRAIPGEDALSHSVVDCYSTADEGPFVVEFEISNPLQHVAATLVALSIDDAGGGAIINFLAIDATPGATSHVVRMSELPGFSTNAPPGDQGTATHCGVHLLGTIDGITPVEWPHVRITPYRS